METLLIHAEESDAVARAATLLEAGEIVALPTETVYGLAADASRAESVAKIFTAKARPWFDPLIVHLPHVAWLDRVCAVPVAHRGLVERLAGAFWPGPLTILLPRRAEIVPDLVTAGSEQVAVRISGHPVFHAVITAFGRPLAAPSANRFGRISPTTGMHVYKELSGSVPLILEAGPTSHGLESTIVTITAKGHLHILRHGPITREMLSEHREVCADPPRAVDQPAAPGQLPGHYAPRTPLRIYEASTDSINGMGNRRRVGLLAYRADRLPSSDTPPYMAECLSQAGDLQEAAVNLFAAMRRLDEAGLDLIVAEPVPMQGLGRAIMDRLRRAAAGSGDEPSHDCSDELPR